MKTETIIKLLKSSNLGDILLAGEYISLHEDEIFEDFSKKFPMNKYNSFRMIDKSNFNNNSILPSGLFFKKYLILFGAKIVFCKRFENDILYYDIIKYYN